MKKWSKEEAIRHAEELLNPFEDKVQQQKQPSPAGVMQAIRARGNGNKTLPMGRTEQ